MKVIQTRLGTAVVVVLLATGTALLAGQLIDRPVLVSYVTTGSMEPTLSPGDGFVAIPAELAGAVTAGDVIVFRATTVGGGGLTTHRVAAVTDDGYLTRGDANRITDQTAGEPVVARPQVVATALQVDGNVVPIPGLGTAAEGGRDVVVATARRILAVAGISPTVIGFRTVVYGLFAVSVLWTLLDTGRGARRERHVRRRQRADGHDTRFILGTMALVVAAAATVSMVAPAGPYGFEGISAAVDSDRPGVIQTGETESATYIVRNGGLLPVTVFLEPASPGVTVDRTRLTVDGRKTADVPVELTAPADTGLYRLFLVEHRYLAVLPGPVTEQLFSIHPWLPIVAIDALLAIPVYLVGLRLVGTGRHRIRSRSGPSRIRRLLARYGWYVR
jgi:signal peptidase